MRIAGVSNRLSDDGKLFYFTVEATQDIPAAATATIGLKYKYERIKMETKEEMDAQPENGTIISTTLPLQGMTIIGDRLEGYVDITDIADRLLEEYLITTSFGTVLLQRELEPPQEPGPDEKPEIEEEPDPSTEVYVVRLWSNYNNRNKHEFWISNAYLDTSKSVTLQLEIPQEFGFPGVYTPIKIGQDEFDSMLGSPNLKEQNGKVYLVKSATGVTRVAILFSNIHRTYAEYFDIFSVYHISPTTSYDRAPTRIITSQGFVHVNDVKQTRTMDGLTIESVHFNNELFAIAQEYRNVDITFDRYTLTTADKSQPSFELNKLGSTNTDQQ
jgi:hypothetical protein